MDYTLEYFTSSSDRRNAISSSSPSLLCFASLSAACDKEYVLVNILKREKGNNMSFKMEWPTLFT